VLYEKYIILNIILFIEEEMVMVKALPKLQDDSGK